MNPLNIIKHAQERGCNATTLRDAAHEMCHALDTGATDWSRDGIHASLVSWWQRSDLLAAEFRARAVERIVCAAFGESYDSAHWMLIAWMETTKMFSGIPMDFFEAAVGSHIESDRCQELAAQIIAIGET